MTSRNWVLGVLSVACGAQPQSTVQPGSESPAASEAASASNVAPSSGSHDSLEPASAASSNPTDAPAPSTTPASTQTTASGVSEPDVVASDDLGTNVAASPPPSNSSSDVSSGGEPSPTPGGEPVEVDVGVVPTARGEHGVGMLDDEVYVLGGFTPAVTDTVEVYTPATDSWREVAPFPVVFHHPNVATVGGKLYVLGFHAGSGQRMADGSSYAYDPTADEWTPVSPMPPESKRGASCVTTYQDKVYIFGGTNGEALPDASAYDPATDEWETLPFLPAHRHHCVAAALNDKIYIVSGRDVIIEEVQAESYVYDPAARTYEEVAPILTPRGGSAGALLGGKIYVFGGEGNVDDPNGIFHETEVYDPATDRWSALPDMSLPRHGFGAAVVGDKIYLPAGSKSRGIDVVNKHTVFYLE